MLASDLRAHGLRVGTGELLLAHRALASVDPASLDEARLALRAALCAGRSDLAVFDLVFAAWCGFQPRLPIARAAEHGSATGRPSVVVSSPPAEHDLSSARDEGACGGAAWSDIEALREKDFALLSDAERALARRIMLRIAAGPPYRRSRRVRASRQRSHRLDVRATLREAMRHGGEPFERRWQAPVERHRPLVLLCDISGSMEPYSRALLQYAHACVRMRSRCEVFAFGTRLTRITAELRRRDPDSALCAAASAVADWSGGTRIGEAIGELNRGHGGRVGRGAAVVVLSDGWDRGEPELLGKETARLARCSHRLVWLNPLKANPDYQPLTRGMVAALPHVDHFLAGNSLASLEELARLVDQGLGRKELGRNPKPRRAQEPAAVSSHAHSDTEAK